MSSSRIWVLLGSVIIVAVLAGGFFLGVQPELAAASRSAGDRVLVESQNAELEMSLKELERQAAQAPAIRSEIGALRESIPASPAHAELLRQLDAFASAAGVRVTSVSPQDPVAFLVAPQYASLVPASVTGDTFAVLPMTLSASGSFEQVTQFVAALQTAERLLFVSDVVLSLDEATATYTADITANMYALAAGATASTGGSPTETAADQ